MKVEQKRRSYFFASFVFGMLFTIALDWLFTWRLI